MVSTGATVALPESVLPVIVLANRPLQFAATITLTIVVVPWLRLVRRIYAAQERLAVSGPSAPVGSLSRMSNQSGDSPSPSGYGTPSSPSYGKYGQGAPTPPTATQPYGSPPDNQPVWGQQPQDGQPQNGPGVFQASGGLGTAVIVLSGLLTLCSWASALLSSSADRQLEAAAAAAAVAAGAADRSADTLFTSYHMVGVVGVPTTLAVWIVTCIWLSRARENALRIDPNGQRRSTVWVWLGWLVPFVSLWFPKQILDDTLKSTGPAAGDREPPSTGWYWAAWIVMNLLSNAQLQSSWTAAPEDAVVPQLEFAAAIATTVALVLWVFLVRRISAAQDRLAANGASG